MQQILPASNRPAVALDLLDTSMPELLRLVLGAESSSMDSEHPLTDTVDTQTKPANSASVSMGAFGCGDVSSSVNQRARTSDRDRQMGAWTMLATCNWGETAKTHSVAIDRLHLKKRFEQAKGADYADDAIRGESIQLQQHESMATSGGVDEPSGSARTLIHMFEFWTGEYLWRLGPAVSVHSDCNLSAPSPPSSSSSAVNQSPSFGGVAAASSVEFTSVPRHSSRLYSLRTQVESATPLYLGSNLHFSCGLEVKKFTWSRSTEGDGRALHKKTDINFSFSPSSSAFQFPVGVNSDDPLLSHASLSAITVAGSLAGETLEVMQDAIQDSSLLSSAAGTRLTRVPVCSVEFEQGVVREEAWRGFVLLFLPIGPGQRESSSSSLHDLPPTIPLEHVKRGEELESDNGASSPALYNDQYEHQHGTASQWNRLSESLRHRSPSYRMDEVIMVSGSVASNDVHSCGGEVDCDHMSRRGRGPELVRFIDEPTTGVHGVVVRVPVRRLGRPSCDFDSGAGTAQNSNENQLDSIFISWMLK